MLFQSRAAALVLAERGCAIVVADDDQAGARETVELITGQGGRSVFAQTDVRRAADCAAMVAAALEHYGRLDKIGRASCRESVCTYGEVPVVGGVLDKTQNIHN